MSVCNNINEIVLPKKMTNDTKYLVEQYKNKYLTLKLSLIMNEKFTDSLRRRNNISNEIIIKHLVGTKIVAVCFECEINLYGNDANFNAICNCPDMEFIDIDYWKKTHSDYIDPEVTPAYSEE